MKNIKIGVAGLGFIGPAHIEALHRLPGLQVVAVSHSSEEAAAQKAMMLGIDQHFGSYNDLLNSGIEAVHICTPNNFHFGMAKKALEKGIHVICEKPLAMTVKEAEELVSLAEEKQLINAVHFNVRYYPLIRQMKMMREKGELGQIFNIIGTYLQDWLFHVHDYNWRLEPDKSGESRAIADIGSHLMDLLEYISGLKITSVMADFDTVHPVRKKPMKAIETYAGKMLKPEDYQDVPVNSEDVAHVLLKFDNGRRGIVSVSQISAGRKNRISIEIAGSKQNVAWCSETPNELWIGHRDNPNQVLMRDPSLMHPEAAANVSFPGGHNEGFPDTSKQMFKEIYSSIREGYQKEVPYPTFADGLRELLLCEKIIESNKKQQWINI